MEKVLRQPRTDQALLDIMFGNSETPICGELCVP